MNRKSKGINAERELIHLFWKHGWVAARVAGSGSMHYPSPDVIAGTVNRRLVIECKTSAEEKKYLTRKEISELELFGKIFNAESWVGIRFNNQKWFFLSVADLEETKQSHYVSLEIAQRRGLLFEELIEHG